MKTFVIFAIVFALGIVLLMQFGRVWMAQVSYLFSSKDGPARAMRLQRAALELTKLNVVPDVRGRRHLPTEITIRLSPSDHATLEPIRKQFTNGIRDELLRIAEDQDWRVDGSPVVTIRQDHIVKDGRPRIDTALTSVTIPDSDGVQQTIPDNDAAGITFSIMNDSGLTWPVEADELRIGRSKSATITVDHPKISREHVRLVSQENHVILTDCESRNGTMVDGKRVSGSIVLTGSAEIVLADRFTFRLIGDTTDPSLRKTERM